MNETVSAATASPAKVRYGVLGFACSLSMITYLDRVCFGTVAPYIRSEFGLSETQKGMLFSAFALAYAAFEVPSGWVGDVFGPRKTLIRIVLRSIAM
jgi:MFS family permease